MISTLLIAGLFGLVLGSFISMLSWRLPRIMHLNGNEQLHAISFGGSECPQCNTKLPWYRLIPVVSWLATRGHCHQCKHVISARYPLIELSSAIGVMLAISYFGVNLQGLLVALLILWLLTISVIDIEHHLILDNLSLPLMWLGLLINAFNIFTPPQDAILGGIAGYGILWLVFHSYRLITGKEGMGYGDFKLLAALGAWLGVSALSSIILIAALSSLVVATVLIVLKQRHWQSQVAFGPFLAIGGIISLGLQQHGLF